MSESRTPRTDAAQTWPVGCPPTPHERANRYLRLCYDLETLLTIAESRIAELEAEANEHARLLGMSGEREARLLARIAEIEAERERLRTLLAGLQETYAACLSPQMCQAIDAAVSAKEKNDDR